MTPADEATCIALWAQGASYRELAAALGCPLGTVASRSAALAAQGKITPRQRGGAYPNRRAQARAPLALSDTSEPGPVHTPVHYPVQTSAPHSGTVHTSVQTSPDHSPPSPDLSGVLNALVERLSAIEETLKQGGVQRSAPVQSYALPGVEPPRLSAADRKSERWNIYMPRWIRQRIEQAAAVEGLSPSQFLQRLCGPWAAMWQNPPEADT